MDLLSNDSLYWMEAGTFIARTWGLLILLIAAVVVMHIGPRAVGRWLWAIVRNAPCTVAESDSGIERSRRQ